MCATCTQQSTKPETTRARLKLWEIGSHWHCTILGTCLRMADLRSVQDKVGLRFTVPNPSEYEVHAAMVHQVGRNRIIGKLLHKLLEKRHMLAVKRFASAHDSASLALLWAEAVTRGEIGGALWAIMTHPHADEGLKSTVFGEVHMLSHQLGAATRTDLRRIFALEKDKAALEIAVERLQDRLRTQIAAHQHETQELRLRLEHELAESRRLAHAAGAAAEIDTLRALVAELRYLVTLEAGSRQEAQASLHQEERRTTRMAEELTALQADNTSLREERNVLEARLGEALAGAWERAESGAPDDGASPAPPLAAHAIHALPSPTPTLTAENRLAACDPACRRLDLCGRCILYVGGRAVQVPHLRRLVESCNGTLMYHDGGQEENVSRLSGLLGQADVVLFPVDCVSHTAHDQLKRLCRRWDKPFVPVRRSGLGSFLHALESVGKNTPDGDTKNTDTVPP